MPRHFLSIQKKFLLLLLIVGLAPAAIAAAFSIWGTRLVFASAMGLSLESRAGELASRFGALNESISSSFRKAVQTSGDNLQAVNNELVPVFKLNALARLTPEGKFEILNLTPERPNLADSLERRREHFTKFTQQPSIASTVSLEDVNLVEPDHPEGLRLAVFAFQAAGGSVVYAFVSGDEFIRQLSARQPASAEGVFIYSRSGYLLNSSQPPPGLTERAGTHFEANVAAPPGWFSLRASKAGRDRWHVVAYSFIPSAPQASARGIASSQWAVLVAYDMENFLGPQATVIWWTLFAAGAWAFLLMSVAVVAARRIVGPVKTLRYQAEEMAAGNLGAQASVRTRDEIQDLAEAFNTMAGRLRESYQSLEAQAESNRMRAEHINVINEITKAVTQALDLDRTFEILRRDLKGAIDYDGLWIALTQRESGELRVTHAEPARLLNSLQHGDARLEFSFHGRALREGAASSGAIVPEADESGGFESGVYLGLGFASYLVAPLPSVGRILGTITVVSRKRNAYGAEETKVLASVAGAIALAIELAELFEQARRFAGDLERKVAERTRELNRANQKLLQTEKYAATGRLAANLAHEINNPLGIIKNYLKIVTNSLNLTGGGRRATDPNLSHIAIINEELNRIAKIVRQLLDLHRPAEQKVTRTDLCALINEILALVEKDFAQGGIKLHCEFAPGLPMPMVAPDLIRQVLINLIRNAQDAMEGRGGQLTIKAERATQFDGREDRPAVAVSISDTGTGIAQEHMDKIFDPFFTTKTHEKGTGLGLAVSYGIIQMYRGSIDAFSEPGQGTTIVVTLPVDPPPQEKTPPLG